MSEINKNGGIRLTCEDVIRISRQPVQTVESCACHTTAQDGPQKSKPLPNYKKIVLNRIKARK